MIGANQQDDSGVNAGAAYLYRYVGGTWVETNKLQPSALGGGENFGTDIAVSGNRILIGAPLEDVPTNAGAAWVFDFTPQVPLLPSPAWPLLVLSIGLAACFAGRRSSARRTGTAP